MEGLEQLFSDGARNALKLLLIRKFFCVRFITDGKKSVVARAGLRDNTDIAIQSHF